MHFDDLPPITGDSSEFPRRNDSSGDSNELHHLKDATGPVLPQSITNLGNLKSISSSKLALQLAPVPIILCRIHDLRIDWANPAALDFLSFGEQLNENGLLSDYVAERALPQFYESLSQLQRGERELATTTLSSDDGIGLCDIVFTQTNEHILAVAQLPKGAYRGVGDSSQHVDALTGLPDRRSLFSTIEELLAKAENNWGVLFVDLNQYKKINDRYGHIAGDKVMLEFARKLRASSRPGDLVVRYGGDEFAIVVSRIDSAAALRTIAERLAREVRVFVREDKQDEIVVTLSVGCAMASSEWDKPEQILAAADRDMYRNKRQQLS